MREREGERLLERAQRELWAEGSASRRELEAEIRKFICLHLLGRAASDARLRLSVARLAGGARDSEAANAFRALGYAPAPTLAPGLWCRLDFVGLEVLSECVLSEG